MRSTLRLFLVMGEGALIFTATYFGLILIAVRPIIPHVSIGIQATAGAVGMLVPICLAAWWIFRRLRVHYARREARAAAITFGISTPVPLVMGLLLGQIFGGYSGLLLGNRFAFPGAVAGIVLMISLMTFVLSVLTLWVMRRIGRANEP